MPPARLIMKLTISGVTSSRRADEIALVLAILVVGDDDELAGANVGDRLLYRSKWPLSTRGCLCLLITARASMTRSHVLPDHVGFDVHAMSRASAPSVVCRKRVFDERQLKHRRAREGRSRSGSRRRP